MQLKRLKLSALFLLGLGLTGLQAQIMNVKENNGTQTTYVLSNVQKMSFSSGNLTVTKIDNSSGMYALNGINYLNFSVLTSSQEQPMLDQSRMLTVYPNPANNLLNIDLREITMEEGTLSILNFNGKAVLSRQVSSSGVLSLDINHLSNGIYLCRFSNSKETKTVKFIKQ